VNQQTLSALIWTVADLLRGDYKQADYGKVILPFTTLRRLDCVLAPTKAAVLAEHNTLSQIMLRTDSGCHFRLAQTCPTAIAGAALWVGIGGRIKKDSGLGRRCHRRNW
jgi:type I restriction-modification system DNA methylase subunit